MKSFLESPGKCVVKASAEARKDQAAGGIPAQLPLQRAPIGKMLEKDLKTLRKLKNEVTFR